MQNLVAKLAMRPVDAAVFTAALLLAFLLSCSKETGSGGKSTASSSSSSSGGSTSPVLDPEIVGVLGQIKSSNLADSVAKLSSFTTRNTCSDDSTGSNAIGGARDWIQSELSSIPGLTVALDSFTFAGCAAGPVTRENVVAWKTGSGHPGRLIVIGGHYDSRTIDVLDGTSAAPGANDSGSQTALVLEAARVLGPQTFDATIVFVAFAGEEQGLVGSHSFATDYAKYFASGSTIEAMFNSDIVGGDATANDAASLQQYRLFSPGTPREIQTPMGTTDDTSPARGLMRFIATIAGAYVPTMTIVPVLREDRPGRGGDHESFLDTGVPAVRFIEAIESPNAGTAASHQHSPNDLMAFVTPDYAARVTQVVVSCVASLARAPSPPLAMMASGTATSAIRVAWTPPASGSSVDHYVVAGRDVTENFYRTRVAVPKDGTAMSVMRTDLDLPASEAFFLSIAAVDAEGHESLFAYPEYRCDAQGCVVQPGSTDVTSKN